MTRAGRFEVALRPFVAAFALAALVATARDAVAAPPTKVLKGPYVTAFSATTADVRFELDDAGPATVEIAPARAPAQIRKIADATSTANHLVHVTGLTASTTYVYSVTLGTTRVATGQVTTAHGANDGATMHFIVYGDNRSDVTAHSAIVRAMATDPADFLVNTGDIVADGASAADWQSFFTVEASLLRQTPLLLAIGNHELYDDEAGSNFARYFGFPDASGIPRPWGTLRIGMARFFFLNGVDDWAASDERAWLERELTRADTESGVQWRIVVVHQSPWSSGPHGPNPKLVAAHVPELLAAHKVDLVLSGHDHMYERGDAGTMKYIISGGGGAVLYKPGPPTPTTRKAEAAYHYVDITLTPMELRLEARRIDGSVLDKCGFRQGSPWDCDAVLPPPPSARPAPSSPPPAPSAPPAQSSSRCNVGNGLVGFESPRWTAWAWVRALAAVMAIAGMGFARRARRRG